MSRICSPANRPVRSSSKTGLWFGLLALAAAGNCGCGSEAPERLPVVPVRGSVRFQSQPLAGATLVFYPVNEALEDVYGYAQTADDGTFQVSTYDMHDGAPEGEYIVTLSCLEPSEVDGGYGNDRLGNRFLRPDRSPFRAIVVGPETTLEPFEVPE